MKKVIVFLSCVWLAEILEDEIGCDTVLKIGRIIILYKESSKKQNRKISPKVKELNK